MGTVIHSCIKLIFIHCTVDAILEFFMYKTFHACPFLFGARVSVYNVIVILIHFLTCLY